MINRRRAQVAVTMWAALALAGCGGQGQDDRSAWKVVSEGTGQASVQPLSPTWAGIRRRYGSGVDTTVLGPTERWGRTVMRFQGVGDVRFFRPTGDGLLYDGTARIGHLATPILLVPAAVRDGMVWQSLGVHGDVLGTFTVSSRGEQATLFGKVPVWRITQKNEVTGSEFYTDYAEGYGAVEADGVQLVSAVLPRTARPDRATPTRTPVTPLGDGKPLATGFWAVSASLIQPASGPGTLRVNGQTTWFSNDGFSASWVLAAAVACAQYDGSSITGFHLESYLMSSSSTAPCGDASAAVFDAGGTLVTVPVTWNGELEGGLGALFLDGDGVVRGISRGAAPGAAEADWFRASLDPDLSVARKGPGGGYMDLAVLHLGPIRNLLASDVKTGGPVGVAVRAGDRIFHARSDEHGFGRLALAGTLPGAQLSTRLGTTARRHLFTTADGTIDELVMSADSASLARLGELDLPEGHELIAAIPDERGLLVLTLAGRDDWRAGQTAMPKMGDLYAFHAGLPARPDPATSEGPPADELDLWARPSGLDVEVCWRRGTATLDGWTLGGKPARALPARSDGTCAIVLRDLVATPDLQAADAWLVEGPVPGVGRVVFAQVAPTQDAPRVVPDAQYPIASLAGGGFGSKALHYGNAATVIGTPHGARSPTTQFIDPGYADAGGLGVWQNEGEPDQAECGNVPRPCQYELRFGTDTVRTLLPKGAPAGRIAGGGLVWRRPTFNADNGGYAYYTLAGDGTWTALPSLPNTFATTYRGIDAAGGACGQLQRNSLSPPELFCVDRQGVLKTSTIEPGTETLNFEWFWPGAGGFYLYGYGGPTLLWWLDPATAKLKPVELEGFSTPADNREILPAWSEKGDLFVAVRSPNGGFPKAVLQVANGKAKALPLPEGTDDPPNDRTLALLVDERMVIVATGQKGARSLVRIARP